MLRREHKSEFTQVREIELPSASIRLPQGRLFVTVTEQKDFDKIEDHVPDCVQTRLDEFLSRNGNRRGVKVYYLKPLCVEVSNQLIMTTKGELDAAIKQVQDEVFKEYWRQLPGYILERSVIGFLDGVMAIPRSCLKLFLKRKRREIESFHSKLEFERRTRALDAARVHRKLRGSDCTFDEMLSLTNSPDRNDVIEHYVAHVREKRLAFIDRKTYQIASISTAALPWFVSLSLAAYHIAITVTAITSVTVCDPAFVAEIPGSDDLLKIGHFDEVDGVMHVEI